MLCVSLPPAPAHTGYRPVLLPGEWLGVCHGGMWGCGWLITSHEHLTLAMGQDHLPGESLGHGAVKG